MKNYRFFRSLCYNLDLFKSGFSFNFPQGVEKFSTAIGTIVSLVIYAILLFSFVNSDMVQKSNPKVISQLLPQTVAPNITLNNNNFPLFFSISDYNLTRHSIDQSYISIKLSLIEILTEENLNKKMIEKEVGIHECKKAELASETTFLQNSYVYCPDEFEWTIQGSILDSYSTQIGINIYICENNTSNNCSASSEIESYLQNKFFGLYYKDIIPNLNLHKNFLTPFPRSAKIILSANAKTTTTTLLKKGEILQDDDVLFESWDYFEYFSKDVESTQTVARSGNDSNQIGQLLFASSQNSEKTTRVYPKLVDALAQVSGVASFLILIGGIFLNFFTKTEMDIFFINSLFQGHLKNPKLGITMKLEAKSKIELVKTLPKNDQRDENNNFSHKSISNSKLICIPKNEMEERISPVTSRRKVFPEVLSDGNHRNIFALKDFFRIKMKRFFGFRMNQDEELFLLGEKELSKAFDISTIMKTIQDIEIFKNVVLDSEQLILFECIPKPLGFGQEKDPDKEGDYSSESKKMKVLQKNFEMRETDALSKLDLRLLDLIFLAGKNEQI